MASVEWTNRGLTACLILSALFAPLLCPAILQAQLSSRADLLEAEREAKVADVMPPERTTIERGMRVIEKAATSYENIKGRDPNPLDHFEVNRDGTEVTFDNAALRTGAAQGKATYSVQWSALDNMKNEEQRVGEAVELSELRTGIPASAWGPQDKANYRYAVARITTLHPDNPQWQEPVILTVRDKGGMYDVVGVNRPRHDADIKISKQHTTTGNLVDSSDRTDEKNAANH
jgi:hypothetical protein